MTSTDQHNLTSLPNEIKLDILELLFSDSVVSLKGRYSHPKAQPRLLPPAATRRNILLTCRSFFALGIEPFYKLSKLNLHLMLLDERRDQHPWMHTLPYPVVSLQQTQRIHLLNDRALAATVITRFRALRILRLSHLTKTTSDSHVPDARRVLDTLRGRWLCAAQAAMRVRQTKGQFQTILIRVKWEIVNWFRPGKAYDMVSTPLRTLLCLQLTFIVL